MRPQTEVGRPVPKRVSECGGTNSFGEGLLPPAVHRVSNCGYGCRGEFCLPSPCDSRRVPAFGLRGWIARGRSSVRHRHTLCAPVLDWPAKPDFHENEERLGPGDEQERECASLRRDTSQPLGTRRRIDSTPISPRPAGDARLAWDLQVLGTGFGVRSSAKAVPPAASECSPIRRGGGCHRRGSHSDRVWSKNSICFRSCRLPSPLHGSLPLFWPPVPNLRSVPTRVDVRRWLGRARRRERSGGQIERQADRPLPADAGEPSRFAWQPKHDVLKTENALRHARHSIAAKYLPNHI